MASVKESSRGVGGLLKRLLAASGVLLLGALLWSCFVIVDETEYVIVERFGEIREGGVYDRPQDRGLHLKLPWPIETVRRFDRRLQIFDSPPREMHTSKRRNVVVDTYVCWRIADPETGESRTVSERPVVRFFRSLGDKQVAESRLDTRVRTILGAEMGKVELAELLSVVDSEAGPVRGEDGKLARLSEEIQQLVVKQPGEAQSLLERFGIEVVDVRIKRLNLPSGNRQAVYDRMRSERRKDADRYRTEGLAQKQKIESQANRQYEAILARARADAERIRGDGEARAIEILNEAHAQDPRFYQVMRTLDTYRKILNEKTTLVLSADSNLLKLLTDGIEPDEESSPPPKPKTAPSKKAGGEDVSQRTPQAPEIAAEGGASIDTGELP